MSMKFALAGLVALGGDGLMAPAASAMPNGLPGAAATQTSGVENVRWVCGPRGNCWWQQPRRFYRPYAYYPARPVYRRPHDGYGHPHWRRW